MAYWNQLQPPYDWSGKNKNAATHRFLDMTLFSLPEFDEFMFSDIDFEELEGDEHKQFWELRGIVEELLKRYEYVEQGQYPATYLLSKKGMIARADGGHSAHLEKVEARESIKSHTVHNHMEVRGDNLGQMIQGGSVNHGGSTTTEISDVIVNHNLTPPAPPQKQTWIGKNWPWLLGLITALLAVAAFWRDLTDFKLQ